MQDYKLWYSYDGTTLYGPIKVSLVKKHPNNTITFRIIDRDWLDKNGWGIECYVEQQAPELPSDRKLARDKYAWE